MAYLFGGRDTLEAGGLTYADYARRGFFELLAAAGLAALVVATLDARVRQRSRAFVAGAIVLVGLTGVTLVSSFLRLRLYQDAYGWTELRFWVLLSIGWLAAALLALGVLVARGRSGRLVHVLGALGIAAVVVANVVGPQGYVAGRNLERALDPALVPRAAGPASTGPTSRRSATTRSPRWSRRCPTLAGRTGWPSGRTSRSAAARWRRIPASPPGRPGTWPGSRPGPRSSHSTWHPDLVERAGRPGGRAEGTGDACDASRYHRPATLAGCAASGGAHPPPGIVNIQSA